MTHFPTINLSFLLSFILWQDNKLNKTIYPVGKWTGTYFSEELKAVQKHGYKIKLIKGYEFSKIDLFTEYVNHFFNLKKISSGSERFIAKMHLNQLYGIFGRKRDIIETVNIYSKDLPNYLLTRVVKSIIKINDDVYTLLLSNNINSQIIDKLNTYFNTDFINFSIEVKSNVAIASAVTAYARIHMIPYILYEGTVYTNTDSIFTTKKLPDYLIGNDLGWMKDELDGCIIKEAYFLDVKK